MDGNVFWYSGNKGVIVGRGDGAALSLYLFRLIRRQLAFLFQVVLTVCINVTVRIVVGGYEDCKKLNFQVKH